MTDLQYTLTGYAVGILLLLGYGALVLWKHHVLSRRDKGRSDHRS